MSWLTIYWLPPFISGALSAGLAVYLWPRRDVPPVRTLILIFLVVALWSFAYVQEILTPGLEAKLWCSRIQWPSVVAVSPLWFFFALQYSGREQWLTRFRRAVLIGVPALALALAWTTGHHHFIWRRFWIETTGPAPMLAMERGLGFWVLFVFFSYTLVFLGTVILVGAFLRSRHLFRKQVLVLLIGVTVPWGFNVLFLLGFSPLPRLDLTPAAFTVSTLALAWGLFRFQLLDIMPVARETIIESMADAVLVLDLKNRVVDLNSSARRLVGLSDGELLGRDAGQVFAGRPGMDERYLSPSAEAREEIRIGSRRFDLQITALRHPAGGQVGRLVVLRDITPLKKALAALSESEERHRAVLEASVDPIVVYDVEGRVLYVNPSFTRVFGWHLHELEGRAIDFVPEELQEQTRTMTDRIMGGEVFRGIETRRYTKWGNLIDVSVSAAYFQDREGRTLGSVVNLRDVTGAKRLEQALREAGNYLQNVVDSMPSVLVGVDGRARVTQWNAEAERLTGLTSREVLGSRFIEVFPWLAPQMGRVEECLRFKQPRQVGKLTVDLEGKTRYFSLMVYPLTAAGQTGAVVRLDDVTDRLRIEEIMVQTEKMMSVGGLAAGMAHEINNPLGGIIQGVQNILRRLSPDLAPNLETARLCGTDLERMQEYLERRQIPRFLEGILESGRRAAKIVTNMLEFSRHGDSVRVPARLEELLEKTVALAANDYDLKKRFDFRHIEVIRDYDPDLPPVACEPTKIEQVLFNLLKNAAQAMLENPDPSAPPPRIVLRTRGEANSARLEIEDNGPGMTEEVRRRIFEPFFTTKPVGAGTGLGLSVSYFIVTNDHLGSLSVESEPGRGARFIVTLPLGGDTPLTGLGV
ncbi:MAG: histidine kinase N-terminal 7TM domain-containing protein [Thermodesulfobacteriota bacterium]